MHMFGNKRKLGPFCAPPSITHHLLDQVVSEGEQAEFSITVTGHPTPSVSWFSKGKEIVNSPDFNITCLGDRHFLRIVEVFNEDRGLYSVVVKNRLSQCTQQARLHVKVATTNGNANGQASRNHVVDSKAGSTAPFFNSKPTSHPAFSKKLLDIKQNVGEDVILECGLPMFPVPEKAKWWKDGMEVGMNTPGVRTSSRHGVCRLVIEKATSSHSGVYACKSIVEGQLLSTQMVLTITDPNNQKHSPSHASITSTLNHHVSNRNIQLPNDQTIPQPPPFNSSQIDIMFSKTFAPKFTQRFGRCVLVQGSSVLLQCRVIGEPLPNIQWFHDGHQVRPTTATNKHVLRYNNHTGDCSLTINMATQQDVGNYNCVALNKVGRDTCEGEVVGDEEGDVDTTSYLDPHSLKIIMANRTTVMGKQDPIHAGVSEVHVEPRFLNTHENSCVEVCVGETAKLKNKIAGQPQPDVAWFKEGVEVVRSSGVQMVVNQEGEHSLVLKGVGVADGGIYTCRASNRAGRTTKEVLLVVSADLKASITSAGHVQESVRQVFQNASEDGGVVVDNGLKGFASDSPKKKMSSKQSQLQVSLHDEIMNIKSSTKPVHPIPEHQHVAPEKPKDLNIPKMIPKSISTIIPTSISTIEETPKVLEHFPPKLLVLPKSCVVDEGGRVKFCTKVSGDPNPSVTWSINGLDVFSSSRINVYFDGLMNVLEILKAKKYDDGEVKVVARNYKGATDHTVSLSVKEPFDFRSQLHHSEGHQATNIPLKTASKDSRSDSLPSVNTNVTWKLTAPMFIEELKDIEVDDGDCLNLACVVLGSPTPVVSWFRNDEDVNMLEDYSFKYDVKTGLCRLIISDCMPDDSGSFTCVARNNHGVSKTTCQLVVKDLHKKELKIENMESPKSARRLSFNDLKQMLKSDKINNHFTAPTFLTQLTDIEADDGTQACFRVEYDGLPTPTIEWIFKEEAIQANTDFFIETDPQHKISSLTIMELFPDDEGEYHCKAANLMGSALSSCFLNVKEPPLSEGNGVVVPMKEEYINEESKEINLEEKCFSETISMSSTKSSLRSSPVPSCPSPYTSTTKSSEIHFRSTPVFNRSTMELSIPELISQKELFLKRNAGSSKTARQEVFMDVSQHRSFSETQISYGKTNVNRTDEGNLMSVPAMQKVKTPDSVRKKRRIEAVKRKNSLNQLKNSPLKNPPVILKHLEKEVKVTDGQAFNMTLCLKSTHTNPDISWYFNDKLLIDNPDVESCYDEVSGEAVLKFYEVFPQDSGAYKCLVQNECGQVSSTALLLVEEPKTSKHNSHPNDEVIEFLPAQEIPENFSKIPQVKEETKALVPVAPEPKLNHAEETISENKMNLNNEIVKMNEDNLASNPPSKPTISLVERQKAHLLKHQIENRVESTYEKSNSTLQEISTKGNEDVLKNINFVDILETGSNSKISKEEWVFRHTCLQLIVNALEHTFFRLPSFQMPICEELTLEVHYNAEEEEEKCEGYIIVSEVTKGKKSLVENKYKKEVHKSVYKNYEMTPNNSEEIIPQNNDSLDNGKIIKNEDVILNGDVAPKKVITLVKADALRTSSASEEDADSFFDCQEIKGNKTEKDASQKTSALPETIISPKTSIITHLPSCLELIEGQTLKLECQFLNTTPVPNVKWTKNGQEIRKSSRIKIDTESEKSSLEVTSISMEDEALYEVVMTNKEGLESRSESRVLVESFKKSPEDQKSKKPVFETNLKKVVKEKDEKKTNELLNDIKSQRNTLKETQNPLQENTEKLTEKTVVDGRKAASLRDEIHSTNIKSKDKEVENSTTSETTTIETKSYFTKDVLSEIGKSKKTNYFKDPRINTTNTEEAVTTNQINVQESSETTVKKVEREEHSNISIKDKKSENEKSDFSADTKKKTNIESSNQMELSPLEESTRISEATEGFNEKSETETTHKHSSTFQQSSHNSTLSTKDTSTKYSTDKKGININNEVIKNIKVTNEVKDKGGVKEVTDKSEVEKKDQDAREQKYVSTLTEEITFKDVNSVPQKFSTRVLKTVEYTNTNSFKHSSKDDSVKTKKPLISPFKNQNESEFNWKNDDSNTSILEDKRSEASTIHMKSSESDQNTSHFSKLNDLETEYKKWKEQTSKDFSRSETQFHDFTPDSSQTENILGPSDTSYQSIHWTSKETSDGAENEERYESGRVDVVDVGSTAKPQSREQSSGDHLEISNKEVQHDNTPLLVKNFVLSQSEKENFEKPNEKSTTIQEIETTDEITVETKVTQVKMVSLQLLDSGEINLTETTQVQTDTDMNETKKTREKEELVISHGIEDASNQLNQSALTDVSTINEGSLIDHSTSIRSNHDSFSDITNTTDIPKYDLYKTWEVENMMFLATNSYEPDREDVISLHDGEKVELLDVSNQEWWLVRKIFDNRRGFVPSKFLKSKTDFDREISDLLSPMLHKIISDETDFPCVQAFEANQSPAMMAELLQNVRAKDGESGKLECVIHGDPIPLIVWFYNHKILKPSPDFLQFYDDSSRVCSLQIKEVYPEDGGRYTVVAKNSTGVASSSAELVVMENELLKEEPQTSPQKDGSPTPSIISRPKSQFVDEGDAVNFTCKFQAGNPIQIFWLKEKKPLKPDERISITASEDGNDNIISKLHIKDCRPTDGGKFTVGALGSQGDSIDCTVTLNVKASTKVIDFKSNLKKKSIVKKQPEKQVEKKTNIEETVNRKQVHSHTESATGHTESATGNQRHKTPTQIREEQNQLYIARQLQDQTVYEGETARFECAISKFWPQQKVAWLFQGKPIVDGQYYKTEEDGGGMVVSLEVYEVHVDDAGLYMVRVSSDNGTVESSCFLKVEESILEETYLTDVKLKKDGGSGISTKLQQQKPQQQEQNKQQPKQQKLQQSQQKLQQFQHQLQQAQQPQQQSKQQNQTQTQPKQTKQEQQEIQKPQGKQTSNENKEIASDSVQEIKLLVTDEGRKSKDQIIKVNELNKNDKKTNVIKEETKSEEKTDLKSEVKAPATPKEPTVFSSSAVISSSLVAISSVVVSSSVVANDNNNNETTTVDFIITEETKVSKMHSEVKEKKVAEIEYEEVVEVGVCEGESVGEAWREIEEEVLKREIDVKMVASESRENTHSKVSSETNEVSALEIVQLGAEYNEVGKDCVLEDFSIQKAVLCVTGIRNETSGVNQSEIPFETSTTSFNVEEENSVVCDFEKPTQSAEISSDKKAEDTLFGDSLFITGSASLETVTVELQGVEDESVEFRPGECESAVDDGVWSDAESEDYLNIAWCLSDETDKAIDVTTNHYVNVSEDFNVEPNVMKDESLSNDLIGKAVLETNIEGITELTESDKTDDFEGEEGICLKDEMNEGFPMEELSSNDLTSVCFSTNHLKYKTITDDKYSSVENIQKKVRQVKPKTLGNLEKFNISVLVAEGKTESFISEVEEGSSEETDSEVKQEQSEMNEIEKVSLMSAKSDIIKTRVDDLREKCVVDEMSEFDAEIILKEQMKQTCVVEVEQVELFSSKSEFLNTNVDEKSELCVVVHGIEFNAEAIMKEQMKQTGMKETDKVALNSLEVSPLKDYKVECLKEQVVTEKTSEVVVKPPRKARVVNMDTTALDNNFLKKETLEILEKIAEVKPKCELKEVKRVQEEMMRVGEYSMVVKKDNQIIKKSSIKKLPEEIEEPKEEEERGDILKSDIPEETTQKTTQQHSEPPTNQKSNQLVPTEFKLESTIIPTSTQIQEKQSDKQSDIKLDKTKREQSVIERTTVLTSEKEETSEKEVERLEASHEDSHPQPSPRRNKSQQTNSNQSETKTNTRPQQSTPQQSTPQQSTPQKSTPQQSSPQTKQPELQTQSLKPELIQKSQKEEEKQKPLPQQQKSSSEQHLPQQQIIAHSDTTTTSSTTTTTTAKELRGTNILSIGKSCIDEEFSVENEDMMDEDESMDNMISRDEIVIKASSPKKESLEDSKQDVSSVDKNLSDLNTEKLSKIEQTSLSKSQTDKIIEHKKLYETQGIVAEEMRVEKVVVSVSESHVTPIKHVIRLSNLTLPRPPLRHSQEHTTSQEMHLKESDSEQTDRTTTQPESTTPFYYKHQQMDVVLFEGSCTTISIPFLSDSPETLEVKWSKLKLKTGRNNKDGLKTKKTNKEKVTDGCNEVKPDTEHLNDDYCINDIDFDDYEVDAGITVQQQTNNNETSMVLKRVNKKKDEGVYEACLEDEFGVGQCLVCVHIREKPNAPTILKLHLKDNNALKAVHARKKGFEFILSWSAPSYNGGETIIKYMVERLDDSWVFCCSVPGHLEQVSLASSLFLKSPSFRVAAENICGLGEFSEPSESVLVCSLGSNIPPWFIRKFPMRVEMREGTPLELHCSSNSEANVESNHYNDTPENFDLDVKSRTDGDSNSFDTTPCAPESLTVEQGADGVNTNIVVKWTPPKNLNLQIAETMAGYVLEKRNKGEEDWKLLAKIPSDVLECEVGDLTKGKDYFLKVSVELNGGLLGPSRELLEPLKIDDVTNALLGCVPLKPCQPRVMDDMDGLNRCMVMWEVPTKSKEDELLALLKHKTDDTNTTNSKELYENKSCNILHYIVERKECRGPHKMKVVQQVLKHPPLVLEGLEEGVEYEFRVLACNHSGNSAPSDASKPFKYKSQEEQPVRFIKKLKDKLLKEKDNALFDCQVTGNPRPRIRWFKNFGELFEDDKHQIRSQKDTGEGALVVLGVGEEDCCEIECRASNKISTASSRASLTVHTPAKLRLSRKTFESLQFVGGTKMKVRVPISGRPSPKVEWHRGDGGMVQESERVSFEQDEHSVTMCVKDCCREDAGTYEVKIHNSMASDQASFKVTVTDKPYAVLQQPKITEVTKNSCRVEWKGCDDDGGSPVIEYLIEMMEVSDKNNDEDWKLSGKCATTHAVMKGLKASKSYRFAVRAKNIFGVSDLSPPSEVVSIKKIKLRQASEYDKYVAPNCEAIKLDVSRLKCESALSTKYKIYEEISRGPYGAMHRAEDRVSGESWLARFVVTTPLDKMLLKQEISIVNGLHHPNIIRLHDAYETEGEIAFIFELLSGPDLLTRLADETKASHSEIKIINYIRQICQAVCHLHSNNVIHLDLKPETIFFTTSTSETLKVCSFGSAKLLVADRCTRVFHSSINHLSPEVISYCPVSFASDIWSLGALAYTVISGKRVVEGGSTDEVADILTSNLDLLKSFNSPPWQEGVSKHCKDWISRCLVRDPHQRMNINEALSHPWLNGEGEQDLASEQLPTKHLDSLKQLLSAAEQGNDILPIGVLSHEGEVFLRLSENCKEYGREVTMELPDQAPVMVTELGNSEVYEGSVARFKCKFDGRPEPSVQWFHKGKKLEEEAAKTEGSRSVGLSAIMSKWGFWNKNGVAMLSINDVVEEDAGVYKCTATNAMGSCTTVGDLSVQTFSWKSKKSSRRSVSVKSDDDDLPRSSVDRVSIGRESFKS